MQGHVALICNGISIGDSRKWGGGGRGVCRGAGGGVSAAGLPPCLLPLRSAPVTPARPGHEEAVWTSKKNEVAHLTPPPSPPAPPLHAR